MSKKSNKIKRVRLDVTPMPKLIERGVKAVNRHFAKISAKEAHRDSAHRRKREVANQVWNRGPVPASFAKEAELRGVTPLDLAFQIKDLPDAMDERELARQTVLIEIENAETPAEIDQALEKAGVAHLDPMSPEP